MSDAGREALGILQRLRGGLRATGFDAYISGDPRSLELAGTGLRPRRMREVLEPLSDLSIYVATLRGRGDGRVSEITAMQITEPRGSGRRALLIEEGYPLSSILDPSQGGYLADPPITVIYWRGQDQLLAHSIRLANVIARVGRLP